MTPTDVGEGNEAIPLHDVVGAYSSDGSAELLGTRDGLTRLADFLKSDGWQHGRLSRPQLEIAGYDHPLDTIHVRTADGPVARLLDDGVLSLRGGSEYLEILSENVLWLANNGDESPHIHLEYHDGHDYLAPGPVCIIVSFVENLG